jgi:hypothetical protein
MMVCDDEMNKHPICPVGSGQIADGIRDDVGMAERKSGQRGWSRENGIEQEYRFLLDQHPNGIRPDRSADGDIEKVEC